MVGLGERPGVLSSNGGLDFASLLRGMGELGYGFAYRVLDAQYFGVAQRRRRVFVVGYLGDWRAAAAVLFERYCLQGHSAPSREKREDPAKCLTRGAGQRYDFEPEDLIAQPIVSTKVYENHPADSRVKELDEVCSTVTSRWGTGGGNSPMVAQPIAVGTDLYNCSITGDVSMTLKRGDGNPAINQPTVMQAKNPMAVVAPTLTAAKRSKQIATVI
jgi:DNA (cytosine-5)-methyltransferase 1